MILAPWLGNARRCGRQPKIEVCEKGGKLAAGNIGGVVGGNEAGWRDILGRLIDREDRRLQCVEPRPMTAALAVVVEARIEAEKEQVRGGRQNFDAPHIDL